MTITPFDLQLPDDARGYVLHVVRGNYAFAIGVHPHRSRRKHKREVVRECLRACRHLRRRPHPERDARAEAAWHRRAQRELDDQREQELWDHYERMCIEAAADAYANAEWADG